MRFKPLFSNALVRLDPRNKTTAGGLEIPDNATRQAPWGTVLAVGPGRTNKKGVGMSELEALNAQDEAAEAAVETAVHAPEGDEVVAFHVEPPKVVAPPAPIVFTRPCALDDALLNAKVVMVQGDEGKVPILVTRDGETMLQRGDIAWVLPVGAKVQRTGAQEFTGTQLSPALDRPPLVGVTARGVIERFVAYFHAE